MSAHHQGADAKLSKHLRQMKFMKRCSDNPEQEETVAQKVDADHWVLDIPELAQKVNQFVSDGSYVRCCQLRYGRMSFKGFNPEIEKIQKAMDGEIELEECEERENELTVDDEEMAERYSTLVGTIGDKFKKKKQRQKRRAVDDENDTQETSEPSKKTKKDNKASKSENQTTEHSDQKIKKKKKKHFLKPADD